MNFVRKRLPGGTVFEFLKGDIKTGFRWKIGLIRYLASNKNARKYVNRKLLDYLDQNGEWFDFNGIRIANVDDPEYRLSLVTQSYDLILPYLTGHNHYCKEGPYEYGAVVLEKGDTVIDCGANIGVFSVIAAMRGCNVLAFEPFAETAENLKTNLAAHDNATMVPKALTEKSGNLEISVNPKQSVVVEGVSIDEYAETNRLTSVDFIKADIEGAERDMLRGAVNVLKEFQPKLSICKYHLPDDVEVLTEIIKTANPGYEIDVRWKKIYAHVPK
jgi:FkbM family methyltransferase